MEEYQSGDEDYQHSDQGFADDFVDEEDHDSKLVAGTAKGPTMKVIAKETLSTAQEEDLSIIMELLSLSVKEKHQARRLHIFHRCDVEKLFAKFGEKDKTLLLAEVGVSEEHCDSSSPVASSMMCGICRRNVPCDQATRMDCGHCFCNKCWRKYFIIKINEGQSKHIRCMQHKCKYYCHEDVVRTLVSQKSREMAEKFERYLLKSYIDDNKRAKWCPSSPHCVNAIYVEELWVDEYNAAWIKNKTRPCPKCNISVQKIGGCDTIRCICGKKFCWQVGGAKTAMEDSLDQEAKREESRHAYDHYKAHMESLEERRLRESIGKMMDYFTPGDYSWVNDGVSTLVRSRRVLSYSYTFELYMFEGELLKHEISDEEREIKHNLFKDHREQLGAYVEKLSEILRDPFESSNEVSDIRMQVINLSAVINKFCERIVHPE